MSADASIAALRIYVIAHDDASLARAEAYAAQFPWMRAVRVPKTPHMESEVFRLLARPSYQADWNRDCIQFVGLMKYNFEEKLPFYDFPALCAAESNDWDAWSFVNNHEDNYGLPNPSMLTYAGICHTLFPVLWFLLFHQKVPLERLFSPDIPAFYSNAWISKKPLFASLVLAWMPHVFYKLENEEPLKSLAWYNANYLERIPLDDLKAIMGCPYYTYHAFLLERVPCLAFFMHPGARIRPVGGNRRRAADDPEPGLGVLCLKRY